MTLRAETVETARAEALGSPVKTCPSCGTVDAAHWIRARPSRATGVQIPGRFSCVKGKNGNKNATIRLWARGHSYKIIATTLGVEPSTVKEYIRRARTQYELAGHDASGRANLLALLRKDGLA